MGSFKPLLELGGVPVIRRVIDAMRAAGVSRIAVVTGHNRDALSPYLRDVTELYNGSYAEGMFSSVQTGIRYFSELGADGVLLTPADYPLLQVSSTQLELSVGDSIVIPCYTGEEGHPVSLPAWIFPHILTYDGESGLRRLLAKYEGRIVRVPVETPGAVLDMDTPADYERIRKML
jgi:CTP:molybdopterin cytidylyltransferase MocA